MQTLLDVTPIYHTRKQCQMHAVARNVAQQLKKYAPSGFGVAFDYNRVYFAMLDNWPVTVREYVEGEFQKYVNNTGECMVPPNDELGTLYEKAQTFVHYSYCLSARKFMLLDLQGAAYNLYHPEIATLELQSTADQELYFCAGNLSKVVFENFKKNHKCGVFCSLIELTELA